MTKEIMIRRNAIKSKLKNIQYAKDGKYPQCLYYKDPVKRELNEIRLKQELKKIDSENEPSKPGRKKMKSLMVKKVLVFADEYELLRKKFEKLNFSGWVRGVMEQELKEVVNG